MQNKGQFQKGASGNPAGRPPGSRNRAAVTMEALLEGDAEKLMQKATELALGGEISALRLCMERLLPPRKERPIRIDVGPLENANQLRDAVNAVIRTVAEGEITVREGEAVSNMISAQASVLATVDFESRLDELEQRLERYQLQRAGATPRGRGPRSDRSTGATE
jgi:hypothetical protein